MYIVHRGQKHAKKHLFNLFFTFLSFYEARERTNDFFRNFTWVGNPVKSDGA